MRMAHVCMRMLLKDTEYCTVLCSNRRQDTRYDILKLKLEGWKVFTCSLHVETPGCAVSAVHGSLHSPTRKKYDSLVSLSWYLLFFLPVIKHGRSTCLPLCGIPRSARWICTFGDHLLYLSGRQRFERWQNRGHSLAHFVIITNTTSLSRHNLLAGKYIAPQKRYIQQ